jgi:CheY-like chemotaxis protein
MSGESLEHCRILVAEDEYLLADDVRDELEAAGARELGPVATLIAATRLIGEEAQIDGAVLDINLGGELVFPAADMLVARHIPMVFTTGYSTIAIPPRFVHVTRCEKPVGRGRIASVIGTAIHG